METRELRERLERLHGASFAWAVTCCHGDYAEAEEVLQTAYLKVLEGRARFGGRSSFKTWFFSVVRRTALERWRRRRLRQGLLLGWGRRETPAPYPARDAAPNPSDPHADAARSERSTRIRRALGCLSRRQRQVLELVFYQDLTLAEAAAVLGTSLGSARVHYARGKKKLLAALAREGVDD